LACGNQSKSQLALIASGAVVIVQFFVFLLIGVMLYAFYQHFPLDHELEHVNRIFPIFIVEEMPSGVSGLVIAAVFAAAMSTLSSSLNSLSSSSMNDFYRSWLVPQALEQHYFRVSRFFTLGWGVVLILVSFMARDWGEVLQVGLTIASLTMGSVLGIFLLGRLQSAPGPKGGLAAMVCGIVVMVAVASLTPLAWTWYVLVGTSATVTTGVIFGRLETTSKQ
jgi:Na+/proline symporter